MTDNIVKVRPFDPARYLTDLETEAEFLTAALEEDDGDGKMLAAALGVLARKHGMSDMAASAQVNANTLYRSLSATGNPSIATVLRILRAMRLNLVVKAAAE